MYLCENYVEAVIITLIRCFVSNTKIFMNFFIIRISDFFFDFQTLVWRPVMHVFQVILQSLTNVFSTSPKLLFSCGNPIVLKVHVHDKLCSNVQ